MYIDVPWDTASVPVRIDETRLGDVVESRTLKVRDEAVLINSLLEGGEGHQPFEEFLAAAQGTILVLVNDATRPTPSGRVIEIIADRFRGRDVEFMVATGAHKVPGETELEQIFGRAMRERFLDRISSHDARYQDDLVHLGETSRGTPVWVNKHLASATDVLLINSVEPHYFAGYTGGRKSIFPGVAGFETIQGNHKLALDPAADNLALEGNPVHEDMMEMMGMLSEKRMYSIQMVLDHQHRIHQAYAGDLDESWRAAVDHADGHYVVDLSHRYDVVVAAAPYPMDYDLYQSQKALENGSLALKDGGVLILVSKCRHGIGDETFFNLMARASTPDEVMASIVGDYVLGYHKAARLALIANRGEMWGVTSLPDEELEAAFIRPFPSVQKAVDSALARKGPDAKVLFLMDASITVPRVNGG
ncbi:MAG: nickel-dependent lactate racemase family protein [Thermoleophilia bacterium]